MSHTVNLLTHTQKIGALSSGNTYYLLHFISTCTHLPLISTLLLTQVLLLYAALFLLELAGIFVFLGIDLL
jgi:hypothetical protein